MLSTSFNATSTEFFREQKSVDCAVCVNTSIIVNVPVVYMMRANPFRGPLAGVGPEKRYFTFWSPKMVEKVIHKNRHMHMETYPVCFHVPKTIRLLWLALLHCVKNILNRKVKKWMGHRLHCDWLIWFCSLALIAGPDYTRNRGYHVLLDCPECSLLNLFCGSPVWSFPTVLSFALNPELYHQSLARLNAHS
jgi:hypothetical protein